jgi:gamma-glutamyltranspeptidase/glutathione hydrolase
MRISTMRSALAPLLATLLLQPALAAEPAWIVTTTSGVVASDSPQASQVGADVLNSGGNAFDAAIATSLALGVTRPYSTGLGGGGFMLAYLADKQQTLVLDFREMAPAGATPEYYAGLVTGDETPPPTIYGGNAAGVPGLPAGLAEVRKRYGTRPLSELTRGAIRLARDGFPADQNFVKACGEAVSAYAKYPQLKSAQPGIGRLFLSNGSAPKAGEAIRNPELANTLSRLNDEWVQSFYHGELSKQIAAAAEQAGGTLKPSDLANYRVRERQAIRGTYRDYDIFSMPPPSSGGIAIVQTLNILEHARRSLDHKPNPVESVHLRIEAFKHAFADRARWLGDADFTSVPAAYLTDKAYAARLAKKIDIRKAGSPDDCGTVQLPDDAGTSHFCITDQAGNVVSWTETINASFGSFVVVPGTGIILNNEMDDFLTVRGQANLYGLVQGEANLVGPGKRPLSSMSPTLVMKEGKPVLTLGGSGGPRIITSVLNVLLNVIDEELSLTDAMASVRAHHQWQPDELYFDRQPPQAAQNAMQNLGHKLSKQTKTGIVQAIYWLPDGTKVAASDPRKGGKPAPQE